MKSLKKLISILLIASVLFSLCACAKPTEPEKQEEKTDIYNNLMELNAEIGFDKTLTVTATAEADTFADSISASDIDAAIRFIDSETINIKPENIELISPTAVKFTYTVAKDVAMVSVRINGEAAIDGKEHLGTTDSIFHNLGAVDEDIANDVKALKDMLEKGVIDYAQSAISAGVSAYGLLQTLGLVEDKKKTQIEVIQKSVEQVSSQLDTLNIKLDTVYKSLKAELDKIKNIAKENLRMSYASAWIDFKTNYLEKNGGILQQILRFGNKYSTSFCDFASKTSGTFNIYYDTNGNVTVPLSSIKPETGDWISIDGTAVDDSKTISFEINENTFRNSAALKIKSIDNETYMKAFSDDLKAALKAYGIEDANMDAILADALSAVSIEATMNTMNSDGENGTLADDIIYNFTLFCERLEDKNLNPIDTYHNLIYTHYNFQSEALADIEAFNIYILTMAAQGSAYAELAAKFGSVQESKKNDVKDKEKSVAAFFDTHDGLMPDKEGALYCYTTGSYVAGTQYKLTSTSHAYELLKDRVFWVSGALTGYKLTMEWNKPLKNIIDTDALQDMYAVYISLYQNGFTALSFRDYFTEKLCSSSRYQNDIINRKATGLISGIGIEKRNFSLDGSTKLLCYWDAFFGRYKDSHGAVISSACDYFTVGKEFRIGTESTDSSANKSYFVEHSSMYGDVMDLKTCEFFSDKQLVSHAIYAEDHGHWSVAEIWHFVGAADLSDKNDWYDVDWDASSGFFYVPIDNRGSEEVEIVTQEAVFWAIVNVTD